MMRASFSDRVDVAHVVHRANPCGFADRMDEELDCSGVQWQEFHAGWFRDDADIAKQASLDKVNGPYSALQLADDGSHEEIASHTDAGAVERDKCCRCGGDAGLHVDEAMGVDHAVFDLEVPRIAFEVHEGRDQCPYGR